MREILFRGKRVSNGEWVEGRLFGDEAIVPKGQPFLINENYLELIEDIECFEVEADTVGQYTGLTDKNDKKIFEGDIIEGVYQQIFVVEYGRHDLDCCNCCYESHDALGFYMKNKFGRAQSDEEVWEDIEVIGNIHDNPKLVKGEQ